MSGELRDCFNCIAASNVATYYVNLLGNHKLLDESIKAKFVTASTRRRVDSCLLPFGLLSR